ncbi:hypothetical protein [Micromonospora chokoriensis]
MLVWDYPDDGGNHALRVVRATRIEHKLHPNPSMENALTWRDAVDPMGKVYAPYADDAGRVHPAVVANADSITAKMSGGKAYLTAIARNPEDARLPQSAARDMTRLWPLLEEDVAAEVRRLVRGDSAPPRVAPRLMTEQDLLPHERVLEGQWGLALAWEPGSARPALTDGRILGLYLGAVLETQEDQDSWGRIYDNFPSYAMELPERRGLTVMSSDGAANYLSFANTALKDGKLDQERINAIFLQFVVSLTDKDGKRRPQSVIAMVALDNAFDVETNPNRIVIVDYNEGYLQQFEAQVKTEPDSDDESRGILAMQAPVVPQLDDTGPVAQNSGDGFPVYDPRAYEDPQRQVRSQLAHASGEGSSSSAAWSANAARRAVLNAEQGTDLRESLATGNSALFHILVNSHRNRGVPDHVISAAAGVSATHLSAMLPADDSASMELGAFGGGTVDDGRLLASAERAAAPAVGVQGGGPLRDAAGHLAGHNLAGDAGPRPDRPFQASPGWFTIFVHGTGDGRVRVGDKLLSAGQFDEYLQMLPGAAGKPLVLISCGSGTDRVGARFAARLRTLSGRDVIASSGIAGWSGSDWVSGLQPDQSGSGDLRAPFMLYPAPGSHDPIALTSDLHQSVQVANHHRAQEPPHAHGAQSPSMLPPHPAQLRQSAPSATPAVEQPTASRQVAELRSLVDEVRSDVDLGDCVQVMVAVRDALSRRAGSGGSHGVSFAGMLGAGRSVDDSVVGAGPWSGWGVARSWPAVEGWPLVEDIVSGEEGRIGFVLMGRPGRDGHAMVLVNTSDGLVWLDPAASDPAQRLRVGSLPAQFAAGVDLRLRVFGGDGRLVPFESRPAPTLVRGLVDAGSGRYQGSGIEDEETLLLFVDGYDDPNDIHGHTLAYGPNASFRIELETKKFFEGPNGRYYRTREGAIAAGGRGDGVYLGMSERVSAIMRSHPHEVNRFASDAVFDAFARLAARSRTIAGPDGAGPVISLEQLYSGENLKYTELGKQTRVGRHPVGDWPGSHWHFTHGFVVAGLREALGHVYDQVWRDESLGYLTKAHLGDGLAFGDELAARFRAFARAGRTVHPADVTDADRQPLADAETEAAAVVISGYAALVYVNAAGIAQAPVYDGLNKVNIAALYRSSFALLLNSGEVPLIAKWFLRTDFGQIWDEFEARFRQRIPDYDDLVRALHPYLGYAAFDLFDLPVRYGDNTLGDYLRGAFIGDPVIAQEDAIGFVTELEGLDLNDGGLLVPHAVIEIRAHGARHASVEQAREWNRALTRIAGRQYDQQLAVPAKQRADDSRAWLRFSEDRTAAQRHAESVGGLYRVGATGEPSSWAAELGQVAADNGRIIVVLDTHDSEDTDSSAVDRSLDELDQLLTDSPDLARSALFVTRTFSPRLNDIRRAHRLSVAYPLDIYRTETITTDNVVTDQHWRLVTYDNLVFDLGAGDFTPERLTRALGEINAHAQAVRAGVAGLASAFTDASAGDMSPLDSGSEYELDSLNGGSSVRGDIEPTHDAPGSPHSDSNDEHDGEDEPPPTRRLLRLPGASRAPRNDTRPPSRSGSAEHVDGPLVPDDETTATGGPLGAFDGVTDDNRVLSRAVLSGESRDTGDSVSLRSQSGELIGHSFAGAAGPSVAQPFNGVPGWFAVFVHGTGDGRVRVGRRLLSAAQFDAYLNELPGAAGKRLVVLSCGSGASEIGARFADNLRTLRGLDVVASTGLAGWTGQGWASGLRPLTTVGQLSPGDARAPFVLYPAGDGGPIRLAADLDESILLGDRHRQETAPTDSASGPLVGGNDAAHSGGEGDALHAHQESLTDFLTGALLGAASPEVAGAESARSAGAVGERTPESALSPSSQQEQQPVSRTRPWYLDENALGQASVTSAAGGPRQGDTRPGLAEPDALVARFAAELTSPEGSSSAQQQAIKDVFKQEISRLFMAPQRQAGRENREYDEFLEAWDEALYQGIHGIAGDELMWVRPVVGGITPVDPEPGSRVYKVSFGSSAISGSSTSASSGGQETTLEGSFNQLGNHVARMIPHMPAISTDSGIQRTSSEERQLVAGRQMFIMNSQSFDAALSFEVYVNGRLWGSTPEHPPSEGLLTVQFPEEYTEPSNGDTRQPPVAGPQQETTPLNSRRLTRAHEVVNAFAMTPVIVAWHEALMQTMPAARALPFARQGVKQLLNERATLNRNRMLVTGSDHVGGLTAGSTSMSLDLTITLRALQYLGTAPDVAVRDDLGIVASVDDSTEGTSGISADFQLFGYGLTHADPTHGRKDTRHKGVVGGSIGFGSVRASGNEQSSEALNHTVLRRQSDQARYRITFDVTLRSASNGWSIPTVRVSDISGEVAVPDAERDDFEQSLIGTGALPGHRYPATRPPAEAESQPTPDMAVDQRLGSRSAASPQTRSRYMATLPGSTEPLPLTTRRGLGAGVTVGLPGAEAVATTVIKALEAVSRVPDIGQRATSEVTTRTGRPALEADFGRVLAGDPFTVTIGTEKYDVLVLAHVRELIDETSYEMDVNQRALQGSSFSGSLSQERSIEAAVGGAALFALPKGIKFQLGRAEIGGERSTGHTDDHADTIKHYRRTETTGGVTEFVYNLVYEIVVRPPHDARSTYLVDVPERTVAQIVVPDEHAPAAPVITTQRDVASTATFSDEPPAEGWEEASVPLHTEGCSAIYPFFLTMPEVVAAAAKAYSDLNSIDATWFAEPLNWPRPLWSAGIPTELAAHFAESFGLDGWIIPLPTYDGKHQAVVIRARLRDNPQHLSKGTSTEIEHYVQSASGHQRSNTTEVKLGADIGVGAIVSLSSGADFPASPNSLKQEDSVREDRNLRRADGTFVSRAIGQDSESNRAAIGIAGGAQTAWSSSMPVEQGKIDITRATYGKSVHAYRGAVTFQINAIRWVGAGRSPESVQKYVTVLDGLDFIVPNRRAHDLGLPQAEEVDPHKTPAREIIEPSLIRAAGHPERVQANELLSVIVKELAARRLVPQPNSRGSLPPTSLVRAIVKRFSDDALESEFFALTGPGILLWHPVVTPYSATRYLMVHVHATSENPTLDLPRDEVDLTLRGEGREKRSNKRERGVSGHIEAKLRIRRAGPAGGDHGGELKGERSIESKHSATDGTEVKDIFRVGVKRSHEFTQSLSFKVDIGVTHEKPEAFRVVGAAVRESFLAIGFGSSTPRKIWYDNRPISWDWHSSIDAGEGHARVLVPAYLTQPAGSIGAWQPIASLAAAASPAVRWGAAPDSATHNRSLLSDETLHPLELLPVSEVITKWAAMASEPTKRRPGTIDLQQPNAGHVPGLGPLSHFALTVKRNATDSMLRPRIGAMLRHTYEIPGTAIRVGLDIRNAWFYEAAIESAADSTNTTESQGAATSAAGSVGKPLQNEHKGRSYQQAAQSPSHEASSSSGWQVSGGPLGRGDVGGGKKLGIAQEFGFGRAEESGYEAVTSSVAERNSEAKRDYYVYRYDVTVVLYGLTGDPLRIDLDGALHAISSRRPTSPPALVSPVGDEDVAENVPVTRQANPLTRGSTPPTRFTFASETPDGIELGTRIDTTPTSILSPRPSLFENNPDPQPAPEPPAIEPIIDSVAPQPDSSPIPSTEIIELDDLLGASRPGIADSTSTTQPRPMTRP